MFNESKSVDFTMPGLIQKLSRFFSDFEIVIVDDGSTDDSAEKVGEWTRRDSRVRLVRLPWNRCFGGALRAGFQQARKEYVIYTDFDLPVDLECLPRVIQAFADADVLTGFSDEISKHENLRTKLVSKTYNFLVRTFFGIRYRDINFGFKAVRRSVLQQFALRSNSPFVDAELFVLALRSGARIKEIQVPFSERKQGCSQIRRLDVIGATFLDMIKLSFFLRFGARSSLSTTVVEPSAKSPSDPF